MVEAKGLSKAYGEKLLFENLSFKLPQGGIVGIIGPNGAGKTTLFRILTGQEKPDAGEIRIGPSVQMAYVDQSRQSLDDRKTVWAEISNGLDMLKVGNYETPSRAYVGRFNFRGSQQQQPIGELSGGERNRVHLAKVLKEGGNVILLDEPTNDLDIETLRALEEGAAELPGLRGRDLPRSLVPRPDRHAHTRFRGQQRSDLVRGQLFRVRRGPEEAPRRRCGAAAPRALPQPARLNTRARSGSMVTTTAKATLDIDGSDLTLEQLREFEPRGPSFGSRTSLARRMEASVDAVAA